MFINLHDILTPDFLDIHTKTFKMTYNWQKFFT